MPSSRHRRHLKRIKSRTPEHTPANVSCRPSVNIYRILQLLMPIAATMLMYSISRQQQTRVYDYMSPCFGFARDDYYPALLSAATPDGQLAFFSEFHGNQRNMQDVKACVNHWHDQQSSECSHTVLLEKQNNNNKPISCAGEYNRAVCYGWDSKRSIMHRSLENYVARTNFLAQRIPALLVRANGSAKTFTRDLLSLAKFMMRESPSDSVSSIGYRLGKYLKKLAQNLSGASMQDINKRIHQEHSRLLKKATKGVNYLRGDVANRDMMRAIKYHQGQPGCNHIAVVAGAYHVDPERNPALKKYLGKNNRATIFTDKRVSLSPGAVGVDFNNEP